MKEKLFQKLRGANKEGLFQVANEGAEKFKIKWDHIRLLRDSTGMETYAFGVEDINNDPKTFYNLIFKLTPEGTPYQPYLMKYSMTEAFAEQYYATGSFDGFSGSIQKIIIKDLYTAFPGLLVQPDNDEQMVGEPCPTNTQMSNGSSSSGSTGTSGSGSSGTGTNDTYQGSSVTTSFRCQYFVTPVDVFQCEDQQCNTKTYDYTYYEYSKVCTTSYIVNSSSDGDDACKPKTEDTPIIVPDLLFIIEDYGDLGNDNCVEGLVELPRSLVTEDGTSVNITFGTTTDGVNAYQPVAPSLDHMLRFALDYVNYTSGSELKIYSLGISLTTNGAHSSPLSNHYRSKAMDIYMINGMRIEDMTDLSLAYLLQDAFELCHNIRENFGPKFLHKNRSNWSVSTHNDHIHISSNTCN